MAASAAFTPKIALPANGLLDLYARPAEWPGIARREHHQRRFLKRWTGAAVARAADPSSQSDDEISVLSLLESDMQVLFGEIWDLARAYPRATAACLGLITGYFFWG
jgi:hypothetical protein